MAQEFIVQGRIVAGHPGKLRVKKDAHTKQPKLNKEGQPVQQIFFALAVEKNTFLQQVWPLMQNEARGAFPNGIPGNFTYKIKDGDSVDSKGQPYSKREGYAGCYVINFATEGFAPPLYKQEGAGYRQLNAEEFKCGDFAAVKTSIKYNGATSPNTPGLYVNPVQVLHIGYGNEIANEGQDPSEAFAGFQAQQFAGMTAQPQMNTTSVSMPGGAPMQPMQPQGMPGQQMMPQQPMQMAPQQMPQQGYVQQPMQPQMMPQQPMQPQGMPGGQLPAPAHDFVNNAMGMAPQQPQMMPQAAAPIQNFGAQPQYAQQPQGMPGQQMMPGGMPAPR